MIEQGGTLPDFTLWQANGEEVSWSQFRGRPVVLFCYPKAMTPGCTQEACEFRDLNADFAELDVKLVGLSADPVKKQAAFDEKYGLQLMLLSDPEHKVLEALGAWGQKRLYGRVFDGILRSTFFFDAHGKVVNTWPKVKVAGHAQAVLDFARSWRASS